MVFVGAVEISPGQIIISNVLHVFLITQIVMCTCLLVYSGLYCQNIPFFCSGVMCQCFLQQIRFPVFIFSVHTPDPAKYNFNVFNVFGIWRPDDPCEVLVQLHKKLVEFKRGECVDVSETRSVRTVFIRKAVCFKVDESKVGHEINVWGVYIKCV